MSLRALLDAARRHERKLVFGATAFFHLFFIPYFDHKPYTLGNLGNPNEIARVYSVRAMSEGVLYMNRVFNDWPERAQDCSSRPREPRDGPDAPAVLLYPGKSPGSTLFVVPFYYAYSKVRELFGGKVGKAEAVYVCRLFGAIIPSIFLSYGIYLLFRALSRRRYLVLSTYLVYLLGTMAYPYALIFVSHQLASAGIFVAFGIFVWRGSTGWRKHALYFGAGFLVGIAISSEYSALITAFAIGLYGAIVGTEVRSRPGLAGFFVARRHLLTTLAGLAVPIAATLWYNAVAFGSPFKTAYDFLADPSFRAGMQAGWHGFFPPRWEAFAGSFLTPSNGLFFFSPFLLLGLYGAGVAIARKRWRAEAVVALFVFGAFTLYISCFGPWRGGWSVGPRYIANVVPFLAALALVALDDLMDHSPAVARTALGALGVISISVVAPTSVLFPHLPDTFKNPFYEVIVTMIGSGYVNENVLGLPAALALVVFAAALLGVILYLLLGDMRATWRSRLATAAVSLALAGAFHVAAVVGAGVSPTGKDWARKTGREVFLTPPLFASEEKK